VQVNKTCGWLSIHNIEQNDTGSFSVL
jgi:hypothetical protein